MDKVIKIGNYFQVVTIHGDVISKRYKTENGALKALKKLNS